MMHKIDWQAKVKEFKQRGKAQIVWCREQGIPPSTFQYHLKKSCPVPPKRFIELKPASKGLKLHLKGFCIELDLDFDEKTIKRFLRLVASL